MSLVRLCEKVLFVGCPIFMRRLQVGGCLGCERVLVVGSLAETLWRLEKVRRGFRRKSETSG